MGGVGDWVAYRIPRATVCSSWNPISNVWPDLYRSCSLLELGRWRREAGGGAVHTISLEKPYSPDVLLSIAPSFMEFRWKGAGLGPKACRLR